MHDNEGRDRFITRKEKWEVKQKAFVERLEEPQREDLKENALDLYPQAQYLYLCT